MPFMSLFGTFVRPVADGRYREMPKNPEDEDQYEVLHASLVHKGARMFLCSSARTQKVEYAGIYSNKFITKNLIRVLVSNRESEGKIIRPALGLPR